MTARAIAFLRHLAALAVAPAVAPVAVLAYELFRMSTTAGAPAGVAMVAFTSSPLDLLLSVATLWAPAAYAVAWVLGIPIVLGLRAARRLAVPWVVGISVAAAGSAVLAGIAVADGDHVLKDPAGVALLAGLAAALAAGVSGAYCAVAGVPVRTRAATAGVPPLT